MNKKIEDLITAYKYWSSKYATSSHVKDFQKKMDTFKQLTEAANHHDISKDELEKRLAL